MHLTYKQQGETPLECLERFRVEKGISPDVSMTYAGRLDPMAEGLLILLEGEECKDKEKYTGLGKTYAFEILVGFATDTYDLLGLASSFDDFVIPDVIFQKHVVDEIRNPGIFQETLNSFIGKQEQVYPLYSSKTVDGKQLHTYAREGRADFVRPTHEVEIYSLQCTNTRILTKNELEKEITSRIAKVTGDFRQKEILEKWSEVLEHREDKEFHIFSCTMDCSSGTYVRQLVHDIGHKLGVPMTTFFIKRTKVGNYEL